MSKEWAQNGKAVIGVHRHAIGASPLAQSVKNLPAMQETWV